ncbi:GNAT family N-acetyltransferase [Lentimicrobium sp. S6]|uniref:GNAT family N-acetyltransferase n=1 Tax=Lentimicrobium sp. S6 TaxID=2735872 RepID=UPI001552E39A|nr:GNAT family N-acetyltransferase [Lentimicrobium sp. S6]NPD46742.1 GNAT family N-acetyltransferase [Lentimicrobium sp. S6]
MYRVFDINNITAWSEMLHKLPKDQVDIYFDSGYYQIYRNNGDGDVRCFCFEKEREIALYPFLINKVNDLGFELDGDYFDIEGAYGYNGILSSSYKESFINEFYQAFDEYTSKQNIIAEFTRFHPVLNNVKFSEKHMKTVFNRETVFLELLDDYEEIWEKQYSSINRNMIRKARKNNLSIVKSRDFMPFKEMYDETMHYVMAADYYFFNERYYESQFENLQDDIQLYYALLDGEIIGGSLIMFKEQYAHYHLSARKHAFSKLAATNLILDTAIQDAINKGCKYFHFGGGNSSDEKDPLFVFKSNFSKQKGQFHIGKRIHNQEVYNQVVAQWEKKYPELAESNRHIVLKYKLQK